MNYSQLSRCGILSRDEISARVAAGESSETIAAAAGVHRSTLYLALHDWGLVTRRGGDRRSPTWRERMHPQFGGAA